MREGLDAPTFELSPEIVEEIRRFLDGQSRFELAVWVRHEQRGADGPLYDHHLVLAVEDDDWATGDMRALEDGLQLPALDPTEKTWIDIYPLSEVVALRPFGTTLWERPAEPASGLDPLDFRFTREPIEVASEARSAFGELLRQTAPEVVRVHASHTRLWKGDRELESSTSLHVGWDDRQRPGPNTLTAVRDAARAVGIECAGGSLGAPIEAPSSSTVLYDAELDA
jgi:hypothetical protein